MTPTLSASFTGGIDLASSAIGGETLLCSDDFFAGMENLLRPEAAVFDPAAYTDRGKLMDGWESRRKRVPGHDWCILRLGVPGRVRILDIDTAFFLGNHPPFASVDAVYAPGATPEFLRDEADWTEIVPTTPLRRGSQNLAAAVRDGTWTHLRLNIYPDGGVARLRAYGSPIPLADGVPTDLACASSGARAVACSDAFFASMDNLLLPGAAPHMGNGWETRRSRPPGEDWIIVQFGQAGRVDHIHVDTDHFKGNYPDRCSIEAIHWPGAPPDALVRSPDWTPIVPRSKLHADSVHPFIPMDEGPWTHLRLRIYPDGGVSRLRVFGAPSDQGRPHPLTTRVNLDPDLGATLTRACGSRRWVAAMAARTPFRSVAQLLGEADRQWWRLCDADWKEAFSHHPRIGADLNTLRARYAATADWSSKEQAGVSDASDEVLAALAEGNRVYEARFGWIFLVCATGKSALQMLGLLRDRLENSPENELRVAAGEQAMITRLRLEKLVG